MRKMIMLVTALLLSWGQLSAQIPGRKYVGIFYFVWLGQHPSQQDGIFDITKLLKENPGDLYEVKGTPKSPNQRYHFWSEPLYGYYNSADSWVITRHIELLMAAGIDYLMLDTTNGYCYPEVVSVLLDKLKEFQAQGFDVPKVAFYTNTVSGRTVQMIYDHYFKTDRWNGLFFSPEGKPLVVGVTKNNKSSDQPHPDYVSDELVRFFDVRESQWPNARHDENAFPWISWDYPQRIHNGTVSVSVAQHSVKKVCFSDTLGTMGRGYDARIRKNVKEEVRSGRNFQNQWDTVFDNPGRVDNVFVTGWNEWVALKLANSEGTVFVDTFNEEFSRDIEMMKGGYGDNFYLRLVDNIRRFKGKGGFTEPAGKVYRDPAGDAQVRDFKDFSGKFRYTDCSARNDIVEVRVSRDASNIRFTVQTASDVVPYSQGDLNWMNILVKVCDDADKAFEYDYVINRYPTAGGTTSIERITRNDREIAGEAKYSVSGNVLTVTVPRKALGLSGNRLHFDFKVADNVTRPDEIMDYYVSGDSAPIGRLSYSYAE